MAIRPDWTSGTLTLVAGSKDFTTTGSALEIAALQAGDAIITTTGYVLIIEAITGQNSGTLYAECPVAAAGNDQPLRIRYQPDGSRVQGAMRMVRALLTSGNLEAFADLVGEEDAVPVFVGPGVIKLISKSEFGPDDTKGNLAAIAQQDSIANLTELAALENIANLTELAALEKENDQFIVIGDDGTLQLKSIKEITDAIDDNAIDIGKKYTLPTGGDVNQFINGLGALAAMNKAAVGLGNVANIAPSGMWAAMGSTQSVTAASSYLKLPNNVMIQWGTSVLPEGSQYGDLVLPTAFSNMNFRVVGIIGDAAASPAVQISRNSAGSNPAVFSYRKTIDGVGVTNVVRFDYIAIGSW